MKAPRVLIAGIGNIFLGDDAFGVEVAQKLLQQQWPDGVAVEDFGIRGLDLAYALADSPEYAILVDAVPRGQAPGTLYVLEPRMDDLSGAGASSPMIEAHAMDPLKVLCTVTGMGGRPGRVFIVGCEPTPWSEDDQAMDLSPPVRAAVEEAVDMVQSLVKRILSGEFRVTRDSQIPQADVACPISEVMP